MFLLVLCLLVYNIHCCLAYCHRGIYDDQVSPEEQQKILDKHNELRLLIAQGKLEGQPRGVNLKRLKYSPELAKKAQEIANTCTFDHIDVNIPQFESVGQNLGLTRSLYLEEEAEWDEIIQLWWDEHKSYKFGSPFSLSTGHYTQLAWADTEFVGCGYTHYPSDEEGYKYKKFYVCNYGPSGNDGEIPYKVGNSGCDDLC